MFANWCAIVCLLSSVTSGPRLHFDMILTNARMVDVEQQRVVNSSHIAISEGRIASVFDQVLPSNVSADSIIDLQNRLVTPAFIDAHHHLDLSLNQYDNTPGSTATTKRLIDAYTPYGVTSVRSAGGKLQDFALQTGWQKSDSALSHYLDYYFTGQALVGINTGFHNHKYIRSLDEIPPLINQYEDLGIRQLKIYSLIERPMLQALVQQTSHKELTLFAHIEGDFVSLEQAIKLGVQGVEHIKTLYLAVYNRSPDDYQIGQYNNDQNDWQLREFDIFSAVSISSPRLKHLIALIKQRGVNVTPTLAIYARVAKRQFTSLVRRPNEQSKAEATRIYQSGYQALEALLVLLHSRGVQLQVGSDSADPGKTILDEMLLMHDAGLPPLDILTIASYNGAKALGISDQVGSLSAGKKADLIVFKNDPLKDFSSIKSNKSVFKNGRLIHDDIGIKSH